MEKLSFTKDEMELFSSISDDVYMLSQVFQDFPEDSLEYSLAKSFVQAYNELSDILNAE